MNSFCRIIYYTTTILLFLAFSLVACVPVLFVVLSWVAFFSKGILPMEDGGAGQVAGLFVSSVLVVMLLNRWAWSHLVSQRGMG